MEDLKKTLESYEESCGKLRGRISELHRKIAAARESERAALSKRRYQLYTMLWEMEQTMRDLREYLEEPPESADSRAG